MKALPHFLKFLLGIENANSQVTEKEIGLLLFYSRESKIIVEIGCLEGKTTAALAQGSPGTVYTIDTFPKGRLGICYAEFIARVLCLRRRIKNVCFLKGDSREISKGFNKPIDFLFIDADHSYDAVRRDWDAWFPKVRADGYIALHDSKDAINSPNYLGSKKFYEEDVKAMEGVEEQGSVDSLVILRKI